MAEQFRFLHRRVSTAAGVVPDDDWAVLNTSPVLGKDFAAGNVLPPGLFEAQPIIWAKAYNGMGDDASPVASSTATLDFEIVSLHRVAGLLAPASTGAGAITLTVNKQYFEPQLPLGAPVALRILSGTVDPTDLAIWIWISPYSTRS